MKVSIAWAFDYIDANYRTIDVPALLNKLNQITAEIEEDHHITTDCDNVSLVTVQSIDKDVAVYSPEWLKKIKLPKRDDAVVDACYLIVRNDETYRWATSCDLGGTKEMILPALQVEKSLVNGAWKKLFEGDDYIFTVDNKSITHRPDLWGHRGFAREIAAILDLRLKPFDDFCASIKQIDYEDAAPSLPTSPFSLAINDSSLIPRFAGLSIAQVRYSASLLWMVTRLSRIDSRAIDAMVDTTNYVMFDTSQPMHAFDAHRLDKSKIYARRARNKETITLIDDQMIELIDDDLVIADGNRPIALAGIMGGKETRVSSKTTALFLESANFNASTIRRSSHYHKIRTQASARFEKSLDPNQNTDALKRFVQLIIDAGIIDDISGEIISLGLPITSPIIHVSHQFIEDRLGISIAASFVRSTLEKLGFGVKENPSDNGLAYTITVPTFRATKDVMIPEDIVEEIGRFYGYSAITPVLPSLQTKPSPIHRVVQQYTIKQLLAFGLSMREIYTYAFFDESFLHTIGWDPGKTAQVKDPISENWYRLVTTLMPAMFKAVAENYNDHDQLRFFEWARCWQKHHDISEGKRLTGIFYAKHNSLDFYVMKAELAKLFIQLDMPIQWNRVLDVAYPWFALEQTAHFEYQEKSVGIAGMVDASFLNRWAQGSAFIFELNADILVNYQRPVAQFVPLSKYPEVNRDISMIVSNAISVEEITMLIRYIDPTTICSVLLIDMFQKKQWDQERALTFRYTLRSKDKTMTKNEIDTISKKVEQALVQQGVTIR